MQQALLYIALILAVGYLAYIFLFKKKRDKDCGPGCDC